MKWCNLLAFIALPVTLAAQTRVGEPAASYEQRYAEVMALAPREDRVAAVDDLVIARDVARFRLVSGKLILLSSVGGRTVGAAFQGRGSFEFVPPNDIERDRLSRFEGARTLEAPITAAVFLFADSTRAELDAKLHFAPGDVSGELRSLVSKSLDYLGDPSSQSFDPDLMAAFLNGESSDLFYAHVKREDGGPLMFLVNPFEFEGVTLARRAPRTAWTREPEEICRFGRLGTLADSAAGERLQTPMVRDYRLDITMAQTGSGDLSFAAAARVEVTSAAPVGPWIPFLLFEKLKLDSARWADGGAATVFRGKDSPWLWVRFDQPLRPADARALTLYYHGDLIERYGDFFFVRSTISWYPVSLASRTHAAFDITYHTPSQYLIGSVGDRLDSTLNRSVLTTRWLTPAPIRNASFNLGIFDEYKVKEEGVPPVSVMVSAEGHRQLTRAFLQHGSVLMEQRHMKETVGADVARSLKFFQHVYGPSRITHFYATETPGGEGLAFPGLVDLSWVTFQQTSERGEDEVFRAHEVAHQWWGIGVDFASYHDQWLSEGFANFSGLWYLQVARKANDKYFAMLHQWRDDILFHRDEPSPIWLGYRVRTSKDETGSRRWSMRRAPGCSTCCAS